MIDGYGIQRWVSYYNDSGSVIPPFAVLMLVSDAGASGSTVNYQKRLKAKQYAIGDDFGVFALNGPDYTQPGAYGKCNFAADGPAWARTSTMIMDDSGLGPTSDWIGQEWGPRDGEWEIGPGNGYLLLTEPQSWEGGKRVLVIRNSLASSGVRLMRNINPGPPDPDPLFLGPVTLTGMVTIADCVLADGNITGGSDSTDTVEVSGIYLGGNCIPPGGYFWARSGKDRWYAVCGGVSVIQGDADGGNLAYSDFVPTGFSTSTVNVDVEVSCTGDTSVDGTHLVAAFDGNHWIVISDCCPPDPD